MKLIKILFFVLFLTTISSCFNDQTFEEQFSGNKNEGIAFLEQIQTTKVVTKTDTGLLYEVLTEGTGAVPTETDATFIKFKGTLIDGTEFHSREADALEILTNGFIPAFTEGLQLMKIGSKYRFYIPYQLAFGATSFGEGRVQPYSAVVYEIELLDINKSKREGEAFLAENKLKDGIITTDSGLQYEIIKEGSGSKPTNTSSIIVDYHGTLLDGTVFDSSIDRGFPSQFRLSDDLIKGWKEGLLLMNTAATYKFYIPYDLAYGNTGLAAIPPHATLIFEITLKSFN